MSRRDTINGWMGGAAATRGSILGQLADSRGPGSGEEVTCDVAAVGRPSPRVLQRLVGSHRSTAVGQDTQVALEGQVAMREAIGMTQGAYHEPVGGPKPYARIFVSDSTTSSSGRPRSPSRSSSPELTRAAMFTIYSALRALNLMFRSPSNPAATSTSGRGNA